MEFKKFFETKIVFNCVRFSNPFAKSIKNKFVCYNNGYETEIHRNWNIFHNLYLLLGVKQYRKYMINTGIYTCRQIRYW